MNLKELIPEMSRLDLELSRFKQRFGVKSAQFYQAAIMAGERKEFDASDVYRLEFIEWLSWYKTWLSLADQFV